MYIIKAQPHKSTVFNGIEIFSEICLNLLVYIGLSTLEGPIVSPDAQVSFGYVALSLVAIIISVNIALVVQQSVVFLKRYCRRKKALKLRHQDALKSKSTRVSKTSTVL